MRGADNQRDCLRSLVDGERNINLFTYVHDGAMSINYAASQAHLSVDEFLAQMNDYVAIQHNTQLV